ncbi:MAG: SRPBCC family protein [Myxococcota bacterium]
MQRIELSEVIPAPRDVVWELFTDHAGWSRWAGIRESVLRSPGYPAPNGVGAIRVFRQSGVAVEEEVTAFEPPHQMEYCLTAGAPIRDHHGVVRMEPTPEGGTSVSWTVTFRPWIPGTGGLLRRILERSLRDVLRRLVAHPFDLLRAASQPAGR